MAYLGIFHEGERCDKVRPVGHGDLYLAVLSNAGFPCFRYRCGIESWFAPQERAAQLERDVRGGQLIAVIRVDDSGNAAIVDLQPAAPKSG